MGEAFLGAYAALLVKTCHHRGAFAMGGMAAQIPVKNDQKANDEAFAKVRADKEREVREGHDGTWVAHPALVPVAKEVFDRLMTTPNQLDKLRADVEVTRDMLLELHKGEKTDAGFRLNIRVGVQYIAAWLAGRGAVPIYNLMEDAATAEISRAQIWQWLRYGATLDNGVKVTPQFFERALKEEMARVKKELGPRAYGQGRFPRSDQAVPAIVAVQGFRRLPDHPRLQADRLISSRLRCIAARIAAGVRDRCAIAWRGRVCRNCSNRSAAIACRPAQAVRLDPAAFQDITREYSRWRTTF